MKRTKDKAFEAFKNGRLTVEEFTRYVNLKAILAGISYYTEFQELTAKIERK